MHWRGISLCWILIFIAGVNALDKCDAEYKYPLNTTIIKSNNSLPHEILQNISNDANYILLMSKNASKHTGFLKVQIFMPQIISRYKVALLVNDSIKNEADCSQHNFTNSFNRELHSIDQTVCALASNNFKNERSSTFLYFEHVYTGCYALRFTIDQFHYIVRSKVYIETDYQRTEVSEPIFRCNYDNRKDIDSSRNLVTFTFAISVLSGSPTVILKLIPLLSSYKNKKDACIKYSYMPAHAWTIDLNGRSQLSHCNSVTVNAKGVLTKDIECNFALPVSYNDSYCFLISLIDKRCTRETTWDPPPRDQARVPCSWMSQCSRVKRTSGDDTSRALTSHNVIRADADLLLPIAIGLIVLILVLSVTITSVYNLRLRSRTQRSYLNANLRDLKMTSTIEADVETEDENEKNLKLCDDSNAIILMYARGTKSFMSFMADYREILKLYCGCHVYDWYAACEWDAVAKIGACDWAIQLLKKNYRTIWIDTPTARGLISSQIGNNSVLYDHANVLSDFRDGNLSAVLDYAKRSIGHQKLQYSQHYVVRLEGQDNANSCQDPFADLSPYARYLIPYHLNELCSHLSCRRSENFRHALTTEKSQLRERLIQLKNDS